jgi:hypothetical protein
MVMTLFKEFITVPIAKEYKIAEAIYTVTGEFVFVLFHPNVDYPAICAKVRYITGYDDRIFAAFAARPVNEDYKIAGSAHEALEFEIVTAAEDLRKCMCVKDVMTLT